MAEDAQREFFREVEAGYWAGAEGLKDEEQALIESYLDRAGPTLEAGTGGGRIVRAMHAAGFEQLSGFDFAPELVEAARAAEGSAIAFALADAASLPYGDASFQQALYLQQVLCTIESAAGRAAALAEARRVLRPGGTALFSFVRAESRAGRGAEAKFVRYLRALRALRRDNRPLQSLPRLRVEAGYRRARCATGARTSGGTGSPRRRRRSRRPGSPSGRSAPARTPWRARSPRAPRSA